MPKQPEEPSLPDLLRDSLKIKKEPEPLFVVAYAICVDDSENTFVKLPANRGRMIGPSSYDASTNTYIVYCTDYCQLGIVRACYKATMDHSLWCSYLPLSKDLLKMELNTRQLSMLNAFTDAFESPRYRVEFLQMVAPC